MRSGTFRFETAVALAALVLAASCSETPGTWPEANGFFQVGQLGERWLLVTPEGEPFYSVGVNHVTANNNTDNETGICPYCEAVAADYDSQEDWAEATAERLDSWGFNTIGAWSQEELFGPLMPYTELLNYGNGQSDYFSDEFIERVDRITQEKVVPLRDDPNLVGWFLDNELKWGPDWRSPISMLDVYLELEEGSPGREVAEQYAGDPEGFLFALATRYFRVTTEALRAADPNHLILGARASSLSMQAKVLEAATPYLDVFSINFYATVDGLFEALDQSWGPLVPIDGWLSVHHELSGLPLMATEFSFRSSESDPPNTYPPIYLTFDTQIERAAAYDQYVQSCFAAPYIVGHHWFEYVDQPVGGRGDGEDNNFGLVTVGDEPYDDFVEPVTVTNLQAPHLAPRMTR
jgi:hypothetical protein